MKHFGIGSHSLGGEILVGLEGPYVEDISWEAEQGHEGQGAQTIDKETLLVKGFENIVLFLGYEKDKIEPEGAQGSSSSADSSSQGEIVGKVL